MHFTVRAPYRRSIGNFGNFANFFLNFFVKNLIFLGERSNVSCLQHFSVFFDTLREIY